MKELKKGAGPIFGFCQIERRSTSQFRRGPLHNLRTRASCEVAKSENRPGLFFSSAAVVVMCAAGAMGGMPLGGVAAAEPATLAQFADASDRVAFRAWFVLLADLQFEQTAQEVTDCAGLVRFAYREALRAHTAEWARRVQLPFTPAFPDVRGGPKPVGQSWPLFRVTARITV